MRCSDLFEVEVGAFQGQSYGPLAPGGFQTEDVHVVVLLGAGMAQ